MTYILCAAFASHIASILKAYDFGTVKYAEKYKLQIKSESALFTVCKIV